MTTPDASTGPDALGDRALYLGGLACLGQGAYYESHERLEDLWLRNRSEARPFFQGLIQLAAGLHHLERGRFVPAMVLMREATTRLRPFAPTMLGLDVAHLLLETEACRVNAEHQWGHRLAGPQQVPGVHPRLVPPSSEAFWPHRGVVPHPLQRPTREWLASEPHGRKR